MDLIPKPDQVVSAASNIAHKVLYGGLADLRPMPRTLIDEGTLREVYHYRPGARVLEQGDPVLLVTPLAAPALCFDLRRGCSLVEHFVGAGRPTYLVEYGAVSFKDRALGMEHWIDEVIPTAIREVSAHAGGRPVHVIGWSLGGIFALLTGADDAGLPIASLMSLGSPFDVSLVPMVAPLRPLLNLTDGGGAITRIYQAAGGAPKPLVRWAFQLSSFQKLVTKPIALARNLDDADYLAQIEAVDRFTANMIAYPGRSFGQLYHRFVRGNGLVGGTFELGDRTIDVAAITAPVLVFAGATDGIAPVRAVQSSVPLLTGSPDVRFEIVPGGHLGMLTGRRARDSTWRIMDDWIDEWSSAAAAEPTPAAVKKRRVSKKAAKKAAGSKKTAASKTAPLRKPAGSKKTAASKTAPLRKAAGSKKIAASKTAPLRKAAGSKKSAAPKTAAPKTATPRKAAATKTAAKRPAATKTPAKKTSKRAASRSTIGANPTRRYGSSDSRALGGR